MSLSKLRTRYLLAIGACTSTFAAVTSACAGGQVTLVSAPLMEGDGGILVASADARADGSESTRKGYPADPPEPVRPSWATGDEVECPEEQEREDDPDMPYPFEQCWSTYGSRGHFSAQKTRAARARNPKACCYIVWEGYQYQHIPVPGRALAVPGLEPSPPVERADWSAALTPNTLGIEEHERGELAQLWLRDAHFEHASVAAFARFALDLLAVGAPPELIAGAHEAALDEVRHARACFALASAYAGISYGPGPLDLGAQEARSGDPLVALAVATFLEGCVNETLAAVEARAASEQARDPVVKRALERIASDEERHAELAWKTVAWAIQRGGAEVKRALVSAHARVHIDESVADSAGAFEAHGRLGARAKARVHAAALRGVVDPCLTALISA